MMFVSRPTLTGLLFLNQYYVSSEYLELRLPKVPEIKNLYKALRSFQSLVHAKKLYALRTKDGTRTGILLWRHVSILYSFGFFSSLSQPFSHILSQMDCSCCDGLRDRSRRIQLFQILEIIPLALVISQYQIRSKIPIQNLDKIAETFTFEV